MVANKIRVLLKDNRYSIAEFAEIIGMTKNGFHNALMNDDFKFSTLKKIAEALKVPLISLLDEEGGIMLGKFGDDFEKPKSNSGLDVLDAILMNLEKTENFLEKAEILNEEHQKLRMTIDALNKVISAQEETIALLKKSNANLENELKGKNKK